MSKQTKKTAQKDALRRAAGIDNKHITKISDLSIVQHGLAKKESPNPREVVQFNYEEAKMVDSGGGNGDCGGGSVLNVEMDARVCSKRRCRWGLTSLVSDFF